MTPAMRRLVLATPGATLGQLDGGITLYGQSSAYWSGVYADANEASPTFHWLLTIHPAAFEVGILLWLSIFAAALLLVGDVLALVLGIAVALGHAFGIATWLMFHYDAYQAVNALMLGTAVLLGTCIHRASAAGSNEPYAFRGWSAPRRHAVAAVLVGIGFYLFLIPH